MFYPNPLNSAPSSASTTNSGSSCSLISSGCNTPTGLVNLAEGDAFGDTRSTLIFGVMNASSFVPVEATRGIGISSKVQLEQILLQASSFNVLVPLPLFQCLTDSKVFQFAKEM